MKKKLLFSLLSLFTGYLYAQSVQFGIKGGLNIANLSNNLSEPSSARVNFNAGALMHIHISSDWAIQPELEFSGQGGKYTYNNGQHTLALNYINIPILLQYMFEGGFRLETGPQLGFLISAKDKLNDIETGDFTSADFKNVDFSWPFGLGYLSTSGLGIDARYNLGISNIYKSQTFKMRNSVFQVGIFYQISNHHKYVRKVYYRKSR